MRLPRRRSRTPAQRVIVLPNDEQEIKPRALVCDDNASVTQLLEMMLSVDGWAVDVTTSGHECLEALDDNPPDVVVLDQRMPGMTGLDVAQVVRDAGFDRPILLFSAHLEPDEWARLTELSLLPVSKLDFSAVVRHVNVARRQYLARVRTQAQSPMT